MKYNVQFYLWPRTATTKPSELDDDDVGLTYFIRDNNQNRYRQR